jgi:hypothetical protein
VAHISTFAFFAAFFFLAFSTGKFATVSQYNRHQTLSLQRPTLVSGVVSVTLSLIKGRDLIHVEQGRVDVHALYRVGVVCALVG